MGDFMRACEAAGLLFDPRGDLDPEVAYLQIVRPGIAQMPPGFAIETIGRFGKLTVTMPVPAALCASKLLRGSDSDVEDIVWWLHHANLTKADIAIAVEALSVPAADIAAKNLVLLAVLSDGKDAD